MSRQGERRARTPENVKDFWNSEARDWGEDPRVTIRDHHQRLLGIGVTQSLLDGRKRVLDIGCGSGFSTLHYARVVGEIIGEDFAEAMVARANRFLDDDAYYDRIMQDYAPNGATPRPTNVEFREGTILELDHPDATFNAVVTERVLVNLPTRELQEQAVAEVARVLAPGGVWILTEVSEQAHDRISGFRTKFGLSPMERYWHNLYLDELEFGNVLERRDLRVRQVTRFETYQFLTKVVHPLVVAPDEPKFLAGFNQAARRASESYLSHAAVEAIGYDAFFNGVFRPLLTEHDPDKVPAFDEVISGAIHDEPSFAGCSHQLMYVADRA